MFVLKNCNSHAVLLLVNISEHFTEGFIFWPAVRVRSRSKSRYIVLGQTLMVIAPIQCYLMGSINDSQYTDYLTILNSIGLLNGAGCSAQCPSSFVQCTRINCIILYIHIYIDMTMMGYMAYAYIIYI